MSEPQTIAEMKAVVDEPVVVVDQSGLITAVNEAFSQTFGWSALEIEGKPLSMIIPAHLQDAHNVGFSRFLATEESRILGQRLELLAVGADGVEFAAEHRIVGEKIGSDWTFAATIVPA